MQNSFNNILVSNSQHVSNVHWYELTRPQHWAVKVLVSILSVRDVCSITH